MKYLLFLVLISTQLAFSQESIRTYRHGQNGMELIAKSKSETVIISTFNAKMDIRQDIARKLYQLFKEKKVAHNALLTVIGKEANVIGKCIIKKSGNLTSLEFYYEKVFWHNGEVEKYGR